MKNINILTNSIIVDKLLNRELLLDGIYAEIEYLMELIHYNIINNYLKEKEYHPLFKNIEKSVEVLITNELKKDDIYDIQPNEITKFYKIYTVPKNGTFINHIISYYNYKNAEELIKKHPFFIKSTDPNIIIYINDDLIEDILKEQNPKALDEVKKYKDSINNILNQINIEELTQDDLDHLKTPILNPITHTLKSLDLPIMIKDTYMKHSLIDYKNNKSYFYKAVKEVETKTFIKDLYEDLLKNDKEKIANILNKKDHTLTQLKDNLDEKDIEQITNTLLNKNVYYLPKCFEINKNIDKQNYLFYNMYLV